MKLILSLFLLISLNVFSQQTFEICESVNTFTYSTTIDVNGSVEWFLNGSLINQGSSVDITYDEPGEFQLVAIGYNDLGCPGTPQLLNIVVTQCDPLIYWIPNSFTPDGNEFNQTWGPVLTSGISIDGFKLTIYNRWGVIIWESNDINSKWNGTYGNILVPDGTYTWIMWFDTTTNGNKTVSGHVIVLR